MGHLSYRLVYYRCILLCAFMGVTSYIWGQSPQLDSNNKPIDIDQCAFYATGDDRGPLCHQYFAFSVRSGLSSWDFSQAVADSWLGITVNDSNRVTRLGLNNMNLGGSIAPELGNLSSLNILLLYNNQLSGTIPSELGNLSALTDLRLQENNLIGTIPSELGNLSALTDLRLQENNLIGTIPSELGNLSALTDLRLQENNLIGTIPSSLGNLPSLNILLLYNNDLSGTIPSSLSNLSALRFLYLYNNQLSGTIPSELGNLSSLNILLLYNNQLSGTIPSELGNLSALTDLRLQENNLIGTIPSSLGNLPSLNLLLLYNNDLSGTIPSSLSNLSALRFLYLYNNQLSGTIPSELGNLSSLTSLLLYNNQLSGSIPSPLGNLSSLLILDLRNNKLSGAIPSSLGNLSSLTLLLLGNNQLSGSIPERLKSLTKIRILTLAYNRFLPDDMASFIGGYGTDSNGWTTANRIANLFLSPQTPSHPSGDTLYFSTVNPYIDGLTYRGLNDTVSYTAQYEFNPSTGMAIVQAFPRLSNPLKDSSYTLTTTLTNTGYASPADSLVFTTDVTVVDSGGIVFNLGFSRDSDQIKDFSVEINRDARISVDSLDVAASEADLTGYTGGYFYTRTTDTLIKLSLPDFLDRDLEYPLYLISTSGALPSALCRQANLQLPPFMDIFFQLSDSLSDSNDLVNLGMNQCVTMVNTGALNHDGITPNLIGKLVFKPLLGGDNPVYPDTTLLSYRISLLSVGVSWGMYGVSVQDEFLFSDLNDDAHIQGYEQYFSNYVRNMYYGYDGSNWLPESLGEYVWGNGTW